MIKRVAMIGWEFPPFISGGLGVHCLMLTRELSRSGAGVDFYMPRMDEGGVGSHHSHLKIIEVPASGGINPYPLTKKNYDSNFFAAVEEYNARVVESFESFDAEVVHCHDWITVKAGIEINRRYGIPLVLTIHSTEYDRSAFFMPQDWIIDVEREGMNTADAVIAVSNWTKNMLMDKYGIPSVKIYAVYNGIDVSAFARVGGRDYEQGGKRVLFLARLTRQKGPRYFITAAKKVLDEVGDAEFVVAGKGEMLGELIELSLELGIPHRIRFVGFVPDDEIMDLYNDSEVYVLPSVSEPFGISILEAMASGLPVVVSDSTGVGEALKNALKVPYWDTDEMANKIIALLKSRELRECIGNSGKTECRKFTWAKCANETMRVYESAVQAANGIVGNEGGG